MKLEIPCSVIQSDPPNFPNFGCTLSLPYAFRFGFMKEANKIGVIQAPTYHVPSKNCRTSTAMASTETSDVWKTIFVSILTVDEINKLQFYEGPNNRDEFDKVDLHTKVTFIGAENRGLLYFVNPRDTTFLTERTPPREFLLSNRVRYVKNRDGSLNTTSKAASKGCDVILSLTPLPGVTFRPTAAPSVKMEPKPTTKPTSMPTSGIMKFPSAR